jgi:hypothetical protein
LFIGSTGAFVTLQSELGHIFEWTRGHRPNTTQTLQQTTRAGITVPPNIKLSIGSLEVSAAAPPQPPAKAEFEEPGQSTLTDKCLGGRQVEWHYSPHRGAKAVRDFLDETLELKASSQWAEGQAESFTVSLDVDDCYFFDENKRRITGFKAFVLARRLKAAGAIPSLERVTCSVKP